MSEKSIVQEARDIQLAMELITLGARLQMLESETQLSRGRHASMFCNAWQFLLKTGLCNGVDAVIKAYRLYLEQCPQAEDGPLLALTRAWTLVRFVESGLLQLSSCNCCGGNFITHAHQPVGSFACSLCQSPSRAVKRRKLSQNPADIIPQLLDEQRVQAV